MKLPEKIYQDNFRLAADPELIKKLDGLEDKINEIISYLQSLERNER